MRSSPQDVLCRAEKRRGLDADCSAGWAGLHACLVIITCAQVALDGQFFTHLPKSIKGLVRTERSRSSSALRHGKRFSTAFLTCSFLKEVAELVQAFARIKLVFERHNRNVVIGATFSA